MKGQIIERFGRHIVRFKGIYKTCYSYQEAEEMLTGLRWKEYEGSFDQRDYRRDNPMGFRSQTESWLKVRALEVKCFRNLEAHTSRAIGFFGEKNIKDIRYAELEDFLHSLPTTLSDKSKKNIFITLHAFFSWFEKRERDRGYRLPDFPVIRFELGWRQTVNKETQASIIDELKRISFDINPRIWFAVFILANFPKVRPGELIQVQEQDINRRNGEILIRYTKEGHEKRIFLLQEDIDFIRNLDQGLPIMPFFRHGRRKGVSEAHRLKYSGRFGKDYLYQWWKRACHDLGIEGVDLYGGTKHSTVTAARETMTPEEIRRYLTGHATNQAFDRYLHVDADKQREASAKIRKRLTQFLHTNSEQNKCSKILKLRDI